MIPYTKKILPNGLTVVVNRDRASKLAAVNILYKVGARNENPARTGFAHLFEHLMFRGTREVPNFDLPVQMASGDNNAFTNYIAYLNLDYAVRCYDALAQQNPDINYIGIEKYSSVLNRPLEKMEEEETPLPNICFIRMDAEDIVKVFAKNEVDRIYLNFSDPWPKDRHAKRRLTSKEFMARYDQILVPDGQVEFKTDNRALFDFALEEVEAAGWTLNEKTFDLHADARLNEGNVMTEYEERFSAQGNPICKYIISR